MSTEVKSNKSRDVKNIEVVHKEVKLSDGEVKTVQKEKRAKV